MSDSYDERVKENYTKYLEILGMDDKTYREYMNIALDLPVDDGENPMDKPVDLTSISDRLSGHNEVRLDMGSVRGMGMMIDPLFLGELRANGIVAEMVFRLGRKGEIPKRFIKTKF